MRTKVLKHITLNFLMNILKYHYICQQFSRHIWDTHFFFCGILQLEHRINIYKYMQFWIMLVCSLIQCGINWRINQHWLKKYVKTLKRWDDAPPPQKKWIMLFLVWKRNITVNQNDNVLIPQVKMFKQMKWFHISYNGTPSV